MQRRTTRRFLHVMCVAIVALAVTAGPAGAQSDDYPVTTPTSSIAPDDVDVDSDETCAEGDEAAADGDAAAADGDAAAVDGVGDPGSDDCVLASGAARSEVLSSGVGNASALPVTGGDLVGLTIIGAAMVLLGLGLVARRRNLES